MRLILMMSLLFAAASLAACGTRKSNHSSAYPQATAPGLQQPTRSAPIDPARLEAEIDQAKKDLYQTGYKSLDGWTLPSVIGDAWGYDAETRASIKAQLLHLKRLAKDFWIAADERDDEAMTARARKLFLRVKRSLRRIESLDRASYGK